VKALVGWLTLMIVGPVAVAMAVTVAMVGCYDTTKPTPPCTVNSGNPGCPAFPHDMHRPDAGR
jgi:hypothetical protein